MLEDYKAEEADYVDRFRSLARVHPSQEPSNFIIYQKIQDICRLYLFLTKGLLELSEHQFVNSFGSSEFLTK